MDLLLFERKHIHTLEGGVTAVSGRNCQYDYNKSQDYRKGYFRPICLKLNWAVPPQSPLFSSMSWKMQPAFTSGNLEPSWRHRLPLACCPPPHPDCLTHSHLGGISSAPHARHPARSITLHAGPASAAASLTAQPPPVASMIWAPSRSGRPQSMLAHMCPCPLIDDTSPLRFLSSPLDAKISSPHDFARLSFSPQVLLTFQVSVQMSVPQNTLPWSHHPVKALFFCPDPPLSPSLAPLKTQS